MQACKTVGRRNPNKDCVFPFKSSGNEYNYCPQSGSEIWCATSVYKNKNYQDWGLCGPGCPTKATAMEQLQSGDCKAVSGRRDLGKPCIFPFTSSGIEYHHCKQGEGKKNKGKYWCATKVKSVSDNTYKNWG